MNNRMKNFNITKYLQKVLIILLICITLFSYLPLNVAIATDNNRAVRTLNAVEEKAIECHRYVREHGYTYGGGYNIPDGIYSSSVIDCSAYVSWVLYEIGCESFHTYQETEFVQNCSAGVHPELEEIENKREVQPGDILVYRAYGGYDGHVELAAKVENGTVELVYNCGSDTSISSEGTEDYPETSTPARDISEYADNKIYRVKNVGQRTVATNIIDDDGKMPALVPVLANSIISKYAKTSTVISGNSSSSSSSSNTNTNNSTNSSNSNNTTTNNNNNNTSNSNSNTTTSNSTTNNSSDNGQVVAPEIASIDNGGYESIYTSQTTGRQFKEFKQNADYDYPEVTDTYWGQECGSVSTGIVGSGYKSMTMQDIADELNAHGGWSYLSDFLSDFTGQNVTEGSVSSVEDLANKLASGCVAVIHDYGYSSRGHYLALLDINSDRTEVYVSNPDIYGPGVDGMSQGWNSIDFVYNAIEKYEIRFVTNDGGKATYSNSGNSSNVSKNNLSSVMMNKYIALRDENNPQKGYKLNIDLDTEVEWMLRKLKQKDFKMKDYLSESKQKEYLKNILKACIVIQYPDLRNAQDIADKVPTDEIEGCVKVKRYLDSDTVSFSSNISNIKDDEDDGIYLSYKPYNELKQLIDDSDHEALNYFSLDNANNIVVAGWETLDVDVSIEQTAGEEDPNPDAAPEPKTQPYSKLILNKISYLDQISNYTMPFSLFWSLLVYGGDEDFINELAKLGINTRIVAGCFDATTTKVTTYTYTYDKHNVTEDNVYINNIATGDTVSRKHVYNYKVTEIYTLKTDKPSLKIKNADTWAAIYKMDYKLTHRDTNNQDETQLRDETVNRDYGQAINDDDINERLKDNTKAQERIEQERERLKSETHNYNIQNFPNRYDIINDYIENKYQFSGSYVDLLKEEDVQNFIINFIILGYPSDTIKDVFNKNNIITYYAEKIEGDNIQEDAADAVIRMVKERNNENRSGDTLFKLITDDGSNERTNKTYEFEISAIQYHDYEIRENQKEKTNIDTANAELQEITNENSKVIFKTNPYARENSFVKLFYFSKHAKHNIDLIKDWFFDSVEETAAIADLVDLLKYLFQETYHSDFGIGIDRINELKNMFDPQNMTSFQKKTTSAGTIVGGASYSSIKLTDEELQMLYKVVMAEAGGANVEWTTCSILNRLLSTAFPNTLKEMFTYDQYEVMGNGMFDAAVPSQEVIDTVNQVLKTGDVTGGAIGFTTIDTYGPDQTYEPPIELLREEYDGGGSAVFYTTATIQAELAQYK